MSAKNIVLLVILISKITFSQSKLNYFYSDTIFEYSNMKVDVIGAMSYREHFKTQINFTNLTDSFKIIEPNRTSTSPKIPIIYCIKLFIFLPL